MANHRYGKDDCPQPRLAEFTVGSGWSIETYAIYVDAMRAAEQRFQDERDRRYNEVNIEKEKALKIKETADLAALSLARDIQIYKDEKANELREQINSERGRYVTQGELKSLSEKFETLLRPINDYVNSTQGQRQGVGLSANIISYLIMAGLALAGFVYAVSQKGP